MYLRLVDIVVEDKLACRESRVKFLVQPANPIANVLSAGQTRAGHEAAVCS